MLQLMKIWVFLVLSFFCFTVSIKAQKIDLNDYKNKAQAYAILSAQYSNDAYFYSRKNFFLGSTLAIKQNCDTGIVCAQIAMEYADSALKLANDTCEYAKKIMLNAKDFQLKAIKIFRQIKIENNPDFIHDLSEKSMYAMGNAVTDAYRASLFFIQKEEKTEGKDLLSNNKDKTRLELDEYSYITIKELYGKRLIDIEDEIALLAAEAKKSKGQKLIEINKAIAQLKEEEKEMKIKMSKSEDRLINIRNELNDDIEIVNKGASSHEIVNFYDPEMLKGLVYLVQVGYFSKEISSHYFACRDSLSTELFNDTYFRYMIGNYRKYKDTKAAKIKIRTEEKYIDAFVVAYFDGKKILINEALKKEKETN